MKRIDTHWLEHVQACLEASQRVEALRGAPVKSHEVQEAVQEMNHEERAFLACEQMHAFIAGMLN